MWKLVIEYKYCQTIISLKGIDNIKNLTHERAQNFLAQHNMEERGYLKLKHVIYNMTRTPRPN